MFKKAATLIVFLLFLTVHPKNIMSEEMDMSKIKQLNFGIISTESNQNLKKGFEPFLKDFEKAIGIKVKAFFAADYNGVIEGMRFNKVQLAWFGNKSAIEAVDRANGEVFVQTTDTSGEPGYWSLIIVHKDSQYNSIEDIIKNGKNLNFGNGDVNSTSGYLIPGYYIWAQKGIDPASYFKTARSANHETNIMAVSMKQVDFATNNTETFGKVSREKPEIAKNVKIIWKSPLIPKDPYVWRKDIPKELKSKIKAFFLSYGRLASSKSELQRQLDILKGVSDGLAPFLDSSNKQLIPIREINYAKDIMKIQSDKHLKAGDKKVKIAAIQKKLNALKKHSEYLEQF